MLHPEMAEPIVRQVIDDYVNAGLRIGLKPDWDKFRTSPFYGACEAKFPQVSIENQITIAMQHRYSAPPVSGVPTSIPGYVIRDYINAGFAVGLMPNWDTFRASEFYGACVEQFTKEETEKEIASAHGFTESLDKQLPPDFFGKK